MSSKITIMASYINDKAHMVKRTKREDNKIYLRKIKIVKNRENQFLTNKPFFLPKIEFKNMNSFLDRELSFDEAKMKKKHESIIQEIRAQKIKSNLGTISSPEKLLISTVRKLRKLKDEEIKRDTNSFYKRLKYIRNSPFKSVKQKLTKPSPVFDNLQSNFISYQFSSNSSFMNLSYIKFSRRFEDYKTLMDIRIKKYSKKNDKII